MFRNCLEPFSLKSCDILSFWLNIFKRFFSCPRLRSKQLNRESRKTPKGRRKVFSKIKNQSPKVSLTFWMFPQPGEQTPSLSKTATVNLIGLFFFERQKAAASFRSLGLLSRRSKKQVDQLPTKEAAMRSQLSKIVVVVLVTSALLLTSEAKKSVKMRNKPLKGEPDLLVRQDLFGLPFEQTSWSSRQSSDPLSK